VNFEHTNQKILPKKILNITKYTMHPKAFFAIQDLNNSSDLLLMMGSSMNLSQWILLEHRSEGSPFSRRIELLKLRYSHHDQFWFMALSDW
jgi:hypothetical protein